MPLIQHAVAKVLHSVRKWVEVSSGRGSHHGHSMGGYGWPSTRSCHQSSKASCGYALPAGDASHSHGSGGLMGAELQCCSDGWQDNPATVMRQRPFLCGQRRSGDWLPHCWYLRCPLLSLGCCNPAADGRASFCAHASVCKSSAVGSVLRVHGQSGCLAICP